MQLEPEEAFGDFNDQLIFLLARTLFPKKIKEGMTFEGHALPAACSANAPKDRLYTATDVYPDHVVLDANRLLSGIALRPYLRVESVRETAEKEIGSAGAGLVKAQVAPPKA